MISLIYKVEKNDDRVQVEAVVEDAVQVHYESHFDPPDYAPALCTASFYLGEEEELPEEEDELIQFLEEMELDWEPLPKDWDY